MDGIWVITWSLELRFQVDPYGSMATVWEGTYISLQIIVKYTPVPIPKKVLGSIGGMVDKLGYLQIVDFRHPYVGLLRLLEGIPHLGGWTSTNRATGWLAIRGKLVFASRALLQKLSYLPSFPAWDPWRDKQVTLKPRFVGIFQACCWPNFYPWLISVFFAGLKTPRCFSSFQMGNMAWWTLTER